MRLPSPSEIDPAKLYSTREVAALFEVDVGQPLRWARRSLTSKKPHIAGSFPVAKEEGCHRWYLGATLIRYAELRRVEGHAGVMVIAVSQNAKLGRVAVTYAARQSCVSDCAFWGEGCYAEHDNGRAHWDKITAGSVGVTPLELARREAEMIDDLPADRDLRLHIAGDTGTEEGTRLLGLAAGRYIARGINVKVWAYTHAWRVVTRPAWGPVSVLASCETAEHVAQAHARGYAAALVVREFPGDAAYRDGIAKVIPCPQQTREQTCSDCRLCFGDGRLHARKLTIGFALHGAGTQKAARALARVALPMV